MLPELFQEGQSERFLNLSKNAARAWVLINEARNNLNEAARLLTGIHERPAGIQLHGQGELFLGNAVMYDKKRARICLECLVETI